jgi:enoyl-CoA hydratase/carnithine racemase
MREVHWGLIPDMTGTLMLSRLVRDNVMKDLVFTGRIPPARNLSSRLTQVGSM